MFITFCYVIVTFTSISRGLFNFLNTTFYMLLNTQDLKWYESKRTSSFSDSITRVSCCDGQVDHTEMRSNHSERSEFLLCLVSTILNNR